MPLELVRGALRKSLEREPLVTAMVHWNAARVLVYMDSAGAKRAFRSGVEAFAGSKLEPRMEGLLRMEAAQLGAMADPEVAVAVFREIDFSREWGLDGSNVVAGFIACGEWEMALELYEDSTIPVGNFFVLDRSAIPDSYRMRAMAAAMERWRQPARPGSTMIPGIYGVFGRNYGGLEPGKAKEWLAELLGGVTREPDSGVHAEIQNAVRFHSGQDFAAFELLPAVRGLMTPSFAETWLRHYPEVAKAEQILRALPPPQPPSREEAMAIASMSNRYTHVPKLLEEADYLFQEDVDGNSAPRVLWPSGHAYKLALYHAGRQFGREGARYLPTVPSPELALLATVELAAGILELPMRGGLYSGGGSRKAELQRPRRT